VQLAQGWVTLGRLILVLLLRERIQLEVDPFGPGEGIAQYGVSFKRSELY
jgi:hypothetical protein